MTVHAAVAEDADGRGVVVNNKDGALQAYAWDRSSGELRPVTEGDAATLDAAITPDGEWLIHLVEDVPGSEIGHLHRAPFAGGDAEDLTPDLPPYSPFGLVTHGPYMACYAGIGGAVEALVVRGEQTSRYPVDGMPLGVVIDPARGWLALNEAPVGQGLVGNVRVVDIVDGHTVGRLERARAGAAFGGVIAVATGDGEWKRSALWTPGSDPT
ncbi:MAG: TolB family protein, partial [Ilumatobacteraceae bacterium]